MCCCHVVLLPLCVFVSHTKQMDELAQVGLHFLDQQRQQFLRIIERWVKRRSVCVCSVHIWAAGCLVQQVVLSCQCCACASVLILL